MPTYEPFSKNIDGAICYFLKETDGQFAVNIRLAGPDDATATEHNAYHPSCSWCYLGAAHSGDAHRLSIRSAQARAGIAAFPGATV